MCRTKEIVEAHLLFEESESIKTYLATITRLINSRLGNKKYRNIHSLVNVDDLDEVETEKGDST